MRGFQRGATETSASLAFWVLTGVGLGFYMGVIDGGAAGDGGAVLAGGFSEFAWDRGPVGFTGVFGVGGCLW